MCLKKKKKSCPQLRKSLEKDSNPNQMKIKLKQKSQDGEDDKYKKEQ